MLDAFSRMNPVENLLLFMVSVWRNDDRDRFVDRFVSFETKKLFCARIPAGDDSVKIFAHDRIFREFNDRGQMAASFFVTFTFANVAQISGKNRQAVDLERGNGQFDQNFGAVFAQAGNLDPFPDDRALASFQKMSQPAAMLLSHARWNNQFGQFFPNCFRARKSENPLGGGIEFEDTTVRAHGDDAIERVIEKAAIEHFELIA